MSDISTEYRTRFASLFDDIDKARTAFFSQWDTADNLRARAAALRKIYKLIFQNLFVHFAAHAKQFAVDLRGDAGGDCFPLENLRQHQLSFLGSQNHGLSVVSFRDSFSHHDCIELMNTCDSLTAECVFLPSGGLKLLSELLGAVECEALSPEEEVRVLNLATTFYQIVGWRRNVAAVVMPPKIVAELQAYFFKARESPHSFHGRVFSLLHCAFVSSEDWFHHFSNRDGDAPYEVDLQHLLVELEGRGHGCREAASPKVKRNRNDEELTTIAAAKEINWLLPTPKKHRAESQMVNFLHENSLNALPSLAEPPNAPPKSVNEPLRAVVIQVSSSAKGEASMLAQSIHHLGGRLDLAAKYKEEAALLLVVHGAIDSTEKYLSFVAARKHIVSPRYLQDSCRQGSWIDLGANKHLEYEQNPYLKCHSALASIPPPFANWQVALFCEPGTKMDDLSKVLRRGGCASVECFPIDKKQKVKATEISKCKLQGVTHVIVDGLFCQQRNGYLPPGGFPQDMLSGAIASRVFTLPLVHYVLCGGEPELFSAEGVLMPAKSVPANCRLAL